MIDIEITTQPKLGLVVLDFQTHVQLLGLSASQALELALLLVEKASEVTREQADGIQLRKSPLLNLSALPLNRTGPDADVALPLPLEQVLPVPESLLSSWPADTLVQVWRLGECGVIITNHPADGGLHLSISHPSRDPDWNEISQARYRLLPDNLWFAMFFPPRANYVNIHRFCFQVKQIAAPQE